MQFDPRTDAMTGPGGAFSGGGRPGPVPGKGGHDLDPFDFEIRLIRKAAGPALPFLLKALGRQLPASRKDLNDVIGALVRG